MEAPCGKVFSWLGDLRARASLELALGLLSQRAELLEVRVLSRQRLRDLEGDGPIQGAISRDLVDEQLQPVPCPRQVTVARPALDLLELGQQRARAKTQVRVVRRRARQGYRGVTVPTRREEHRS